jgi:glycosyltransferase involved in cell wall biosynthesis
MNKPLVSIIVPAYNAEQSILESIQSAIDQTWHNKEIIIVNDGSSDNTLAKALQFENCVVKVISQRNQGASSARNRGFCESKGDYIQFLDADDILAPTKIEMQLKAIEAYDERTICSGRWGLFYDKVSSAQFSPNELWQNMGNPVDWLVTAWTKQKWIHPSAWLTPRKLIDQAGLWDENLSLHDDGEFFCRVLLQSSGIVFCESAISYYRKGISNSLSSVVSKKAVESHLRICHLYEQQLLKCENSERTRKACATNYLSFYFDHFPGNEILRNGAYKESERLGGSDLEPTGTDIFHLLKSVFGWRFAKRVEKYYYASGLNLATLKRVFKRNKQKHAS